MRGAAARRLRLLVAGSVALALALGLVACAAAPRAASAAPTSVLEVTCAIPDATIWLDDRMIGEVGELRGGMRVRPGRHRLEVRHDAHYTSYAAVELAPGETRTIAVTLVEVLD